LRFHLNTQSVGEQIRKMRGRGRDKERKAPGNIFTMAHVTGALWVCDGYF